MLYSAGAFLAIWFSSTLVTALNSIPLLPKFMELVGLGYTSWFGEELTALSFLWEEEPVSSSSPLFSQTPRPAPRPTLPQKTHNSLPLPAVQVVARGARQGRRRAEEEDHGRALNPPLAFVMRRGGVWGWSAVARVSSPLGALDAASPPPPSQTPP